MTVRTVVTVAIMVLVALIASPMHANAQAGHKRHINQRLTHQRDRINAGVKSRRLTYQQASKLRHEDAHIRKQANADRANHHGKLTAGEHRKLNGELNKVSHQIHNEKMHGRK